VCGINPIRYGLMRHLQKAPNPSQTSAFEIVFQGLFMNLEGITILLGCKCDIAMTSFATIPLASTPIESSLDECFGVTM
jgi:hypothetical protein